MPSVAQIAALAFSGVAKAIPDAVHAATLTRTTPGTYDPATGAHAVTTATQTGRVVIDTVKPIPDVFPDYVVGPGDIMILIEGVASVVENDRIAFAGQTRTIRAVQDIAGAGSLFYAVCR